MFHIKKFIVQRQNTEVSSLNSLHCSQLLYDLDVWNSPLPPSATKGKRNLVFNVQTRGLFCTKSLMFCVVACPWKYSVQRSIALQHRNHVTATYIQFFVPSSVWLSITYASARATYYGKLTSQAIAHACTYWRASSLLSVIKMFKFKEVPW
jgi:hypothetical protein